MERSFLCTMAAGLGLAGLNAAPAQAQDAPVSSSDFTVTGRAGISRAGLRADVRLSDGA